MNTARKQLYLPEKLKEEIELTVIKDKFPRANDLYIKLLWLGLTEYKKSKEE